MLINRSEYTSTLDIKLSFCPHRDCSLLTTLFTFILGTNFNNDTRKLFGLDGESIQ